LCVIEHASRYHRQMLLPMVAADGQRMLARSVALVVGCGALGCVAADLLARAGVGRLILVDRDVVEPSNLHRQTLFTEADAQARLPKAEAARQRLSAVNSGILIEAHAADLTPETARRLAVAFESPEPLHAQPRVIVDATDNFPTRLLLNDLAVKLGVPFVYGGGIATEGTLATILPAHPDRDWQPAGPTACLRCLVPEPPPSGSLPTCDTAGVLGATTSLIASLQAAEALKCLLNRWDATARTIRKFDLWTNAAASLPIDGDSRDPGCPCCGRRSFDVLDGAFAGARASLCGRNAVQIQPGAAGRVDLQQIASRWAALGPVQATQFMVRVAPPQADGQSTLELTLFADGRAIVEGTTDQDRAVALYARLVGH
jgi:molybdopterin/thiamine biosynthesis adenylyltransferase